jgi:hypothetical protein
MTYRLKSRMKEGQSVLNHGVFSFTQVRIVRAEIDAFNSVIFYKVRLKHVNMRFCNFSIQSIFICHTYPLFIYLRVSTLINACVCVCVCAYLKLPQGGWVHDYSADHIGRRTIKVILEAASEVAVPEPDFVNNKAIIARTMAMNLAYPQIQESVMELVSTQAGTPEVELFSPEVLGIPVNEEWAGGTRSMHFGVIQHILDSLYVGYAVAVGYILASNGELVLSPSPATKINWYRNDRIVTIIRHAKRTNTNSTPLLNSLSSSDGSHATYKADGKRVSMKEIEQQSANDAIASVVRMTMQPAASLDAVLEHQKRAAMVKTHVSPLNSLSLSSFVFYVSHRSPSPHALSARLTSHLFAHSQHEK